MLRNVAEVLVHVESERHDTELPYLKEIQSPNCEADISCFGLQRNPNEIEADIREKLMVCLFFTRIAMI